MASEKKSSDYFYLTNSKIYTSQKIMMSNDRYRHIFFDLDHTLWDFDTNSKNTMKEVFMHFQLDEKIGSNFNDFFEKYSVHNKQLWERYQKGFISTEELKWKRMWRTLLDFKVADEQLSKEMSALFLDILPSQQGMFPYAKEILHYLSEKQYKLHLITNGFEKTQRSKIKNSGIDHFFTHVITSESSMSMKPEKEIFEYAVNRAGTNFDSSVMIGDNLDADIAGAMNAGMDAIFVNHIQETPKIIPTFTIHHLQELEQIL